MSFVAMVAVGAVVGLGACGDCRAQSPQPDLPTLPDAPSKKKVKEPAPKAAEASQEIARLANESIRAFMAHDIPKAEELLKQQLKLQPGNFVIYYNLACCRAMQHDVPGGMDYLEKAIENGFCDIRELRKDSALSVLRGDDRYKAIISNWPAILEARRDANIKGAAEIFKKGYQNSRDERLKLEYRSAFDENSFTLAKGELTKLADWADGHAIPGILSTEPLADDPWVVVILPSHVDFVRWIVSVYGPAAAGGGGFSMIAGSYEHDSKRLVSMDLGATLRHEFFHVLHWRDMTRRSQQHPIWIMEGLCSLVEDYDTDAQGVLHPAPSWRSNTVKKLEKLGKLMPIEAVAALTGERFSGDRPLANYAQARTFFLYLSERDKLKEWYSTYTDPATYRADPTGVKAIEAVFGKPIKDVNKDYKAWVRALPMVPEQITAGMASLGLEIDAGNGEGPVVMAFDTNGARPELRVGDIITAIDRRGTRDIAELVRVLSGYKPGTQVEVAYRRGKLYGTAMVMLVAK